MNESQKKDLKIFIYKNYAKTYKLLKDKYRFDSSDNIGNFLRYLENNRLDLGELSDYYKCEYVVQSLFPLIQSDEIKSSEYYNLISSLYKQVCHDLKNDEKLFDSKKNKNRLNIVSLLCGKNIPFYSSLDILFEEKKKGRSL